MLTLKGSSHVRDPFLNVYRQVKALKHLFQRLARALQLAL